MQVESSSPIVIRSLPLLPAMLLAAARVCFQFIGTVLALYASFATFSD